MTSQPQMDFNAEKKPSESTRTVQLDPSWGDVIGEEFDRPYMAELRQFIKTQKAARKVIYPPGPEIFNALNTTAFDDVKVVILGQDPYHGPDQAHGLCFSVRKGVRNPPSLKNIYKEIEGDLGVQMPAHGDLTGWAKQGVLLLNATLTVEAHNAGSHQGKGWEQFTDAIIHALNNRRQNIVYILWGSYAQKKGAFIDATNNLVLKSVHPSPLSAHRGFFGNKQFSKTNAYLEQHGVNPINWAGLD